MIKVIYTNGIEANFNGYSFVHNELHKMFFIETPENRRIMIPDHSVACIGVFDKERGGFV